MWQVALWLQYLYFCNSKASIFVLLYELSEAEDRQAVVDGAACVLLYS
jgi:hypothetical protein